MTPASVSPPLSVPLTAGSRPGPQCEKWIRAPRPPFKALESALGQRGQAALVSALSSSLSSDPQDIVTESNKFDLVGFIPLLRERIYSNNQYARQFIISWILVLESVPDINLLDYLPEILDGLFQILGDNGKEIRKM
ncbi:hypothetical protein P7K49_036722 [Saguinus oedipus]|uniref:Protein VAC14 homolog n=1 Tax=Saguinus oedipus TaxID=9490 RepID=A0ABQ9TKY1_SAGOE|nr:hypothetical protein P7K49_036722 [Saguinus oedipus]